ncbi:MAG: hypothetical protein ACI8R9_002657 [Paraglaciecola sp.]|jgi:hypothetical protein
MICFFVQSIYLISTRSLKPLKELVCYLLSRCGIRRDWRNISKMATTLKDLHFFKNCSSVVSIVSLPRDYQLSYMDLNRLKSHLNTLFSNTTLKRYALVTGASASISHSTLLVKSPCLSDDFLTLIVAYIKRCFAKDNYCFDEQIDQAMLDSFIHSFIRMYLMKRHWI